MTKLSNLNTADLLWVAAVIQADITAHETDGEVQHPQYSLDDCHEQLQQTRAELKRRGHLELGDYLRQSISEMFNELAQEASRNDA